MPSSPDIQAIRTAAQPPALRLDKGCETQGFELPQASPKLQLWPPRRGVPLQLTPQVPAAWERGREAPQAEGGEGARSLGANFRADCLLESLEFVDTVNLHN